MLEAGVHLLVHNGLVDLMFLYAHFHAPLPLSMAEFLADLADLFSPSDRPSPSLPLLLDSKYIAEYKLRYESTFLEYLFRKSQRLNATAAAAGDSTEGDVLHVHFPELPEFADQTQLFDSRVCVGGEGPSSSVRVCESFKVSLSTWRARADLRRLSEGRGLRAQPRRRPDSGRGGGQGGRQVGQTERRRRRWTPRQASAAEPRQVQFPTVGSQLRTDMIYCSLNLRLFASLTPS